MIESTNPYQKHLFICTNQRENSEPSCSHGGEVLCEYLKKYVKENGLKGKVRITRSGCFDLCAQGPNILVYPDGKWYRQVKMADLEKIIGEHLKPLLIGS